MTQPTPRTGRSQCSQIETMTTRIKTSHSCLSFCIELTLRIRKLRPIDTITISLEFKFIYLNLKRHRPLRMSTKLFNAG
ncbi:BgTH12-07532 [Blumeria graminis f. sp. triticale]|uniref:BgTH12-07532 n=2 Tax=Blumeria graminis f. sp. triticale TaxID=1689686 RepID=A0A9W4D2Z9_BLUGR|nr:BgTH12-07532 [Blumeria graminis f. sp. triticale]